MAEAIGLVASVIQVAGAGLKLSQTLYQYADGVATADRRLKDIAKEIQLTSFVIEELGSVFKQDETTTLMSANAVKTAEATMKECSVVFAEIDVALKKSRKNTLGRLMLPFRDNKIELLRSHIDKLKSTLQLLMQVLTHAHQVASKKLDRDTEMRQRDRIKELLEHNKTSTKKYNDSLKNFSMSDSSTVLDDKEPDEGESEAKSGHDMSVGNPIVTALAIGSTIDSKTLATCVQHVRSLLEDIETLQRALAEQTEKSDHSERHQSLIGSYFRARGHLDEVLFGSAKNSIPASSTKEDLLVEYDNQKIGTKEEEYLPNTKERQQENYQPQIAHMQQPAIHSEPPRSPSNYKRSRQSRRSSMTYIHFKEQQRLLQGDLAHTQGKKEAAEAQERREKIALQQQQQGEEVSYYNPRDTMSQMYASSSRGKVISRRKSISITAPVVEIDRGLQPTRTPPDAGFYVSSGRHAMNYSTRPPRETQETIRREKGLSENPFTKQLSIKFQDTLGRGFTFPLHTCNTWPGIHARISDVYLDQSTWGRSQIVSKAQYELLEQSRQFVSKGQYDLMTSDGDIVMPKDWNYVVEPGMSYSIKIWSSSRSIDARPSPSSEQSHGEPGNSSTVMADDNETIRSEEKEAESQAPSIYTESTGQSIDDYSSDSDVCFTYEPIPAQYKRHSSWAFVRSGLMERSDRLPVKKRPGNGRTWQHLLNSYEEPAKIERLSTESGLVPETYKAPPKSVSLKVDSQPIQQELDAAMAIRQENMRKVLERGERLDALGPDKANIELTQAIFSARRRSSRWNNLYNWLFTPSYEKDNTQNSMTEQEHTPDDKTFIEEGENEEDGGKKSDQKKGKGIQDADNASNHEDTLSRSIMNYHDQGENDFHNPQLATEPMPPPPPPRPGLPPLSSATYIPGGESFGPGVGIPSSYRPSDPQSSSLSAKDLAFTLPSDYGQDQSFNPVEMHSDSPLQPTISPPAASSRSFDGQSKSTNKENDPLEQAIERTAKPRDSCHMACEPEDTKQVLVNEVDELLQEWTTLEIRGN